MDKKTDDKIYQLISDDEELKKCYMSDALFHAAIQGIVNCSPAGMSIVESFMYGLKAVCDNRKGLLDSFAECKMNCSKPHIIQTK
jgi:hypothetical protein